ncbi:thioredoxin family protein [Paenibacillus sp. YPG26]|uniref:thioredoxin family protein n=1 Tax=Paenibacillus sp. YPG26 TaxID=2878915 RepID=UPI00203F36D3|nr:thioredoxin family protein [Paenibacillus sp. YPG26]USB33587.1 thioredoxin family protein [Paenibacillus sp. YPG26]
MSLPEMKEQELTIRTQPASGREAVFFYTALCGTCQLGERMLEIVQAADPSIQIGKININYAPVLRERWRIASVPCLVLLEAGEPIQFEYAMQSVDHLYKLLQQHFLTR